MVSNTKQKETATSFYWFDYETFGISPAWDKPAQFAGQRTNLDLEPIGDPIILYCKPPADYLPNPEACRVTQMRPDDIARRGTNEAEFINSVVMELGAPGTCSVGYNSIRFDDEFTRYTLFRNFHGSYDYEFKDNNSRWDLLDVVRLARALRPDGISWPMLDGKPSNKLELLSKENGIEHTHAHDALSDVEATIGMAKLLKAAQPKLFDFAFSNRDKISTAALLNYQLNEPCIQVSGMIHSQFSHLGIVVPIAQTPGNKNSVIVLDMRTDPEELAALSEAEIAKRVFTSTEELGDVERLNLRTIQINKCPVLVPLKTLRDEDAERLGLDLAEQTKRAATLKTLLTPEFKQKICTAMTREWDKAHDDVDGTLYSGGFFSYEDKQRFTKILSTPASQLKKFEGLFDDNRADALLFRYRARNFPETLDKAEQADWQEHIKQRLQDDDAPWLSATDFYKVMNELEWKSDESELRVSLERYAKDVLGILNVGE